MSRIEQDFLVLGSGLAGLIFALEAAAYGRVTVVAKTELGETNTNLAQGGVASVVDPDDSFAQHTADTVRAGAGLCHPDLVEGVVAEGPEAIELLESSGVEFARDEGRGTYDLGREGGHSLRRVLHASDETGRAIQEALLARARAHPQIRLLAGHCAIDLISSEKIEDAREGNRLPRIHGAYVLDAEAGEIHAFVAHRILLATGGCGKVYRYTSNLDVACGDGLAMAYRAGARLANLEFVQFHPTCLFHPQERRFLLSEALRGEGAELRALSGEAFMEQYHPMGSLAPRDIVARACDQEMKRRGDRHVLLDLSAIGAERVRKRFPMIHNTCQTLGLDIASEPVPVVPAAHYQCGGVITDAMGRTELVNLFAAGEVACTGMHGANRLASNSLLEAIVFARRAARAATEGLSKGPQICEPLPSVPSWDPGKATVKKESVLVNAHWEMVRALMWDFVGIVRNDHRLSLARRYVGLLRESVEQYYWDFILDSDLIELRNISLVAELIIQAAATRRESRGLHYNDDHPEPDDTHWCREIILDPQTGEPRRAWLDEIPFGETGDSWREQNGVSGETPEEPS